MTWSSSLAFLVVPVQYLQLHKKGVLAARYYQLGLMEQGIQKVNIIYQTKLQRSLLHCSCTVCLTLYILSSRPLILGPAQSTPTVHCRFLKWQAFKLFRVVWRKLISFEGGGCSDPVDTLGSRKIHFIPVLLKVCTMNHTFNLNAWQTFEA